MVVVVVVVVIARSISRQFRSVEATPSSGAGRPSGRISQAEVVAQSKKTCVEEKCSIRGASMRSIADGVSHFLSGLYYRIA